MHFILSRGSALTVKEPILKFLWRFLYPGEEKVHVGQVIHGQAALYSYSSVSGAIPGLDDATTQWG